MIEDTCVRNSKVLGILCQMSGAEDLSRRVMVLPWEHGLHSYREWLMVQLLPACNSSNSPQVLPVYL